MEWYEAMLKSAEVILSKGEEPDPIAFIKRGDDLSVVAVDGHKEMWGPAIAAMAKGADAVAFVCATWQVKLKDGQAWDGIKPSDSPYRESVALFSMKERGGPLRIWYAPYECTEDGQVTNHSPFQEDERGERVDNNLRPVWEELS